MDIMVGASLLDAVCGLCVADRTRGAVTNAETALEPGISEKRRMWTLSTRPMAANAVSVDEPP